MADLCDTDRGSRHCGDRHVCHKSPGLTAKTFRILPGPTQAKKPGRRLEAKRAKYPITPAGFGNYKFLRGALISRLRIWSYGLKSAINSYVIWIKVINCIYQELIEISNQHPRFSPTSDSWSPNTWSMLLSQRTCLPDRNSSCTKGTYVSIYPITKIGASSVCWHNRSMVITPKPPKNHANTGAQLALQLVAW